MARPTIVLNRSDVKSELHPNLFDYFLETLDVDPEAEDITLCLSSLDDNEKLNDIKD